MLPVPVFTAMRLPCSNARSAGMGSTEVMVILFGSAVYAAEGASRPNGMSAATRSRSQAAGGIRRAREATACLRARRRAAPRLRERFCWCAAVSRWVFRDGCRVVRCMLRFAPNMVASLASPGAEHSARIWHRSGMNLAGTWRGSGSWLARAPSHQMERFHVWPVQGTSGSFAPSNSTNTPRSD